MRVVIDLDLCGGHGVCQSEAPEIFRVVDQPGGYAHVEVILERPHRVADRERLMLDHQAQHLFVGHAPREQSADPDRHDHERLIPLQSSP